MSTARDIVVASPTRAGLAVLAIAAAAASVYAAGALPVAVELKARRVAPGEPVRIQVDATEAVSRMEGTFLGRPVFMVRTSQGPQSERWSGWSMVALDQQPGLTAIEIRGRSAGGRPLVGTLAVTVAAREFPTEELSVASKYVEPPQAVQQRLDTEREKLTAVYGSRRDVVPPSTPFVRPVPGEPTSVFGTRRVFNGKPRDPHPGLDLRAATGTPVASGGSGRVGLAQDLYYAGKTVIVDHGGGLFTIYAHLSEFRVEEGQRVDAGQVVGLSGATGRVTGPHLHWGAKIGNRPFDPTALLDAGPF